MGFTAPVTAYRLKFEQPDLAGLEVTVRSVPIADFLKLSGLMAAGDTATLASRAGDVFQVLAAALVEWNVEDGQGQPVPADFAGITGLEMDFVMKIVNAWMAVMTGPDEASSLGKDSPSGATSGPVPPLPMEPPSPSPPS